eukprot:878495-Pleurochrysis_carterae.AAC.1
MRGSAPKGVSGSGPEISFGDDEFDADPCGHMIMARTVGAKTACRHGSCNEDSPPSAPGDSGDTKGWQVDVHQRLASRRTRLLKSRL